MDRTDSRRRHGIRRRHRLASAVVVALPTLLVLGLDLTRRASHLATFDLRHAAGYFGSTLLSVGFWATVVAAASRRRGRARWAAAAVFLVVYTLSLAVQGAFFRTWAVYCSRDATVEQRAFWSTWTCALPWDDRSALLLYLPAAALAAAAMIFAARRLVRPTAMVARWTGRLALALGIVLLVIPVSYRSWQSTLPDQLWINAQVVSWRERIPPLRFVEVTRTQRRRPARLPALSRGNGAPRNVVFLLQESVREDVFCSEHKRRCDRAGRHSNEVLATRHPLSQMRAVSSSTVISSSVLLSGLAPTEDFETLHTVPYLWGYAKAAGYSTAYWTSQHVMLFGMRFIPQDQPLDILAVATHLHMGADGDMGASDALLVDRVLEDLPRLPEPFFAMVQLANVHHPRLVDGADAPYAATKAGKRWEEWARYQNAVNASDRQMARLLVAIRDSDVGARTVVVFTSDHGESFWEHGSEGHTKTVDEVEIRVPAWIWAKGATLSVAERVALRRAASEPTYHVDLTPTMLDLLGVWDAPEIASYRERMPGHPLTRPVQRPAPVALTNCSWIWQCRDPSIGLIQHPLKVSARLAASRYSCFDVAADPGEKHDLGEEACGALPGLARGIFGFMPADVPKNANPPR